MFVNAKYKFIWKHWEELSICWVEYYGAIGIYHGVPSLAVELITGEVLWAWEND